MRKMQREVLAVEAPGDAGDGACGYTERKTAGDMELKAAWRLKDAAAAVAELETSNFNRALRIDFLEDQLLMYRRRFEPGALELMEELLLLREVAEECRRQVEMAEKRCEEMEVAVGKETARAQEREANFEETQQRLMKAERDLQEVKQLSEDRGRVINSFTARLRALETTLEELQESEGHERQQRIQLEASVRQQTAHIEQLQRELDSSCDVHVDMCRELLELRSTITNYEHQVRAKDEQNARYKLALDKTRQIQMSASPDSDPTFILLGQLQETQRLIELTKARVCKPQPSYCDYSTSRGRCQPSVAKLSMLQQELHEIERSVRM